MDIDTKCVIYENSLSSNYFIFMHRYDENLSVATPGISVLFKETLAISLHHCHMLNGRVGLLTSSCISSYFSG